jgi:hypothetical protein
LSGTTHTLNEGAALKEILAIDPAKIIVNNQLNCFLNINYLPVAGVEHHLLPSYLFDGWPGAHKSWNY